VKYEYHEGRRRERFFAREWRSCSRLGSGMPAILGGKAGSTLDYRPSLELLPRRSARAERRNANGSATQ
jgi:hypothetical protein